MAAELGAQFGNYLMTHLSQETLQGGSVSRLRLYHGDKFFPLPQEPDEEGWQVGSMSILTTPQRGRAVNLVTDLYTGQRHRAVAGLMIGVAHDLAEVSTGEGLTPSQDLSQHSFRLVRGAAARGLIPHHMVPSGNELNSLGWHGREYVNARHPNEQDVPREMIESGRHTIRQMLRQARHIG